MRKLAVIIRSAVILVSSTSLFAAQVERPDFRIRADFRDDQHVSVGNATFQIKSRFLQMYYGGVHRQDEFRFGIGLASPPIANHSMEILINDYLVDTLTADALGSVNVTYRSDYKLGDEPDRPLPVDFPDLVNIGDIVKVIDATSHQLLFSSPLAEQYARGDVDQNGKVDLSDFQYLANNYGHTGVGPTLGDFTGDNRSNLDDYQLIVANWTDRKSPPPAAPSALALGDLSGDGSIDASDAGVLFGSWGGSGVGDLNHDGIVDAADAGVMFSYWTGDSGPIAPISSVPEPAGLTWLGIGLLAIPFGVRRMS